MGQPMVYPERIKRIKEARTEKGWSLQTLTDKVLDNGDITSLSTVKRVCTEGAEEKKFKSSTLEPIEKALGLLDEITTPAIAPTNEEFYQAVIRELHSQLKESRSGSRMKDIAIAFLMCFHFVMLVLDRVTPGVGWYQPGNAFGWQMKAAVLVGFCFAAAGYFIYRKFAVKNGGRHE